MSSVLTLTDKTLAVESNVLADAATHDLRLSVQYMGSDYDANAATLDFTVELVDECATATLSFDASIVDLTYTVGDGGTNVAYPDSLISSSTVAICPDITMTFVNSDNSAIDSNYLAFGS